jgi:hypothetical protein
MSEFPEIEPFGPRPGPRKEEESADPVSEAPANDPEPVPQDPERASQDPERASQINLTGVILAAAGIGFILGYLASRYEGLILRQSRIDELLENAQGWLREQGPKIAEPIRQGLESTSSTVGEALKKVSASKPLDSLNLFNRPKPRKFFGIKF